MHTFYINVLILIIVSSTCFEHPTRVHPQEDLYAAHPAIDQTAYIRCVKEIR